jgi:hypothetical protein
MSPGRTSLGAKRWPLEALGIVRFSNLFTMNRSAVLFTALFLVGGAFGQLTATFFTDTNCATMADKTLFEQKYQNPQVAELNVCKEYNRPMERERVYPNNSKYIEAYTDTHYVKAIACSKSGGFIFYEFRDPECYGMYFAYAGKSGQCKRDDQFAIGIRSLKIDCPNDPVPPVTSATADGTVSKSGSAPVSLAALTFAFVFAAICTQL